MPDAQRRVSARWDGGWRAVVTAGESDSSNAHSEMARMGDPDTVFVTIKDFRFGREKITINAGDVVVWRNTDQVEHTVTVDSDTLESPLIAPGHVWSYRFTTPGKHTYHCKPHPFMKAEIRVREVKP